jgi:Bacterial TSP3 repeat
MNYKSLTIHSFTLGAVLSGIIVADPLPQPQVSFKAGSASSWNADWSGVAGRTYFAQGSSNLTQWQFLPVIKYGSGLKAAGIGTSGATKYFFRLKYVDVDWISTEQEARNADFDGDGIPNWFEVENLGTDPLEKASAGGDSNSNGLPDGWELFYFGATGIASPNTALKPDGLTNKEKADLGLDAAVDYSAPSTSQRAKYTYDPAGRLTGVTTPVVAANYLPDAEGNILNAN